MKKKHWQGRRNEVEAFTFVNVSSRSKANLHPQSDLPTQITTNATQSTLPHTIVQPKVVNVVHQEIDGDHISTFNMLAPNAVPSLPSESIKSTSSTSQILNDSANDDVSYHPMLIDELESDVMIPELDDIFNQQTRRQV